MGHPWAASPREEVALPGPPLHLSQEHVSSGSGHSVLMVFLSLERLLKETHVGAKEAAPTRSHPDPQRGDGAPASPSGRHRIQGPGRHLATAEGPSPVLATAGRRAQPARGSSGGLVGPGVEPRAGRTRGQQDPAAHRRTLARADWK